jgi:hypothetical protein
MNKIVLMPWCVHIEWRWHWMTWKVLCKSLKDIHKSLTSYNTFKVELIFRTLQISSPNIAELNKVFSWYNCSLSMKTLQLTNVLLFKCTKILMRDLWLFLACICYLFLCDYQNGHSKVNSFLWYLFLFILVCKKIVYIMYRTEIWCKITSNQYSI